MEGIPQLLKEINDQIKRQKQDFLDIKEEITSTINYHIDEKFSVIEKKYTELEEKLNNQQQHINHLEKYIRRKNIIFFGVEDDERTYQELEEKILYIVNNKMNLNLEKHCLEYVSRMGKSKNKLRPVVVTLSTVGIKIELLKRKKLLKETNYYIMEDFPKEVLEKRKELKKDLEKERQQGKNVILKYDKIVILKTQKDTLYNINTSSAPEIKNQKNGKPNKNNHSSQRKHYKNQNK